MASDRGASQKSSSTPISRRRLLGVGSLAMGGITLVDLLRNRTGALARTGASQPGFGRARSCIIILLKGGPSHHDTLDMKPDAPSDVRGEFRPIATRVPGMHVCEHLPRLANVADRFAVLRAVHLAGDAAHSTAAYEMTTGYRFPRPGEAIMTRDDHPHVGSLVSALGQRDRAAPSFAMVPQALIVNGEFRGGQNAGMLGSRFDPLVPGGDPNAAKFRPIELNMESRVDPSRLLDRHRLLESVNAQVRALEPSPSMRVYDDYREQAFAILDSGVTRQAFDLDREPAANRDRYGRSTFGQSVLLARRLIEAGVRLVHVNCMSSITELDRNWDTHKNNFETLKKVLLPRADPALASLLEDLAARALLSETLVVVMGEFGRTPKINKDAGRDHWPYCFSVLVAGAGIPGGGLFGRSDHLGAAPVDRPVSAGQLAATILHALGIDPRFEITTPQGRPHRIAADRPATELWS